MTAISGKKLARLLEKKGWQCARVQGSHHIYVYPGRSEKLSVPIHGNQDLKTGLLRHLLKVAGIAESEL